MPIFSNKDIALDVSNDLVVDANGDIRQSSTIQGLKQILEFRVRTAFNEWQLDPLAVADLTKFIGQNNTEEIGKAIENAVIQAIAKDSVFAFARPTVMVVPTSPYEVSLFVNVSGITTDDGVTTTLTAAFSLDFTTGLIKSII